MIADTIVADSYLLANLRRDIADDIIAGLLILFDVVSGHDMKIIQQNVYFS